MSQEPDREPGQAASAPVLRVCDPGELRLSEPEEICEPCRPGASTQPLTSGQLLTRGSEHATAAADGQLWSARWHVRV